MNERKIKQELFNVFTNGTKEEQEDYVRNLIKFLDEKTSIRKILNIDMIDGKLASSQPYAGYINSNSPIYTSITYPPFYLDSIEPYIFILKEACKNYPSLENFIVFTDSYMNEYFGCYNDKGNREDIYAMDSSKPLHISITEFASSNTAKCSEKSALMHNLFSMLGIKSYLVFGSLVTQSENNTGDHAYILIEEGEDVILYDPQNPVYCYDKSREYELPMVASILRLKNTKLNELDTITFNSDSVFNPIQLELVENQSERLYNLPSATNEKTRK